MRLPYPKRVPLANTPTPLVHLSRTSQELGVDFWIKRDDLTGVELSGNKVRKLEFLLAEAAAQGADTIITGGGEQSNHCRATAMAAAKLGMRCTVCLRIPKKSEPPKLAGNSLLDALVGAEIVWIDHDDWQHQEATYEREAERLRSKGRLPYIIPEGGSNPLGSWGYIRACEELLDQLPNDDRSTTLVYACGSGGTGAGLCLGAKALDLAESDINVVGFNVCDSAEFFVDRIATLCRAFGERFQTSWEVRESDIRIVDGYKGRGYAKSSPEELQCLRRMAEREAILLDPVYTGKAFYGLTQELARDPTQFGQRIIFIHTGGIFGLFPKADEILACA